MWKSKFYGAFVLNHRVDLHAVDATPARWRGDAGSPPLDRTSTAASPDALVDFHTDSNQFGWKVWALMTGALRAVSSFDGSMESYLRLRAW